MYNDYTGKALHEAKHRDFIREAQGGWRLNQARADTPRPLNLKRVLALGEGVLMILLLAATLTGCQSAATEALPTPAPVMTATLEADPTPAATATLKPTATRKPTATPDPITIDFARFENNPVLVSDPANAWEEGVRYGSVVFKDGMYHLFYTGGNSYEGDKMAIGYASSADGFTFTKYEENPILAGDGSGFDAYSVSRPVVVIDGETWVLYYTAHPEPGHPLGGPAIGRATAQNPAGPWTHDPEPVLQMGSRTEWDGEPDWFGVVPSSVIITDAGYVMYYTSHHSGDIAGPRVGGACGMATSPDGIHWAKYDDPSTTKSPLAESDPILRPGGPHDNQHAMDCRVFKSDNGWGMVYASLREGGPGHQISFASSPDGIHWTKKDTGKPFLRVSDEPLTEQADEFPDLWPSSIIPNGSTYLLYYGIGWPPFAIGVATGGIER